MQRVNQEKDERVYFKCLDIINPILASYPTRTRFLSSLKNKENKEATIALTNQNIMRLCENIKSIRNKSFPFYKELKELRNKIAHSRGEESEKEIRARCEEFYRIAQEVKKELAFYFEKVNSKSKEVRNIENFGSLALGRKEERIRLTRAFLDSLDDNVAVAEKLPLGVTEPERQLKALITPRTSREQSLLEYAKGYKALLSEVESQMLNFINDFYKQNNLDNPENPYFQEATVIDATKGYSDDILLKSIDEVQKALYNTPTGRQNTTDFLSYKNQVLLQKDKKVKNKISKKVLSQGIKDDLSHSLIERFNKWQLDKISKEREEFLNKLYERIENFRRIEASLSPLVNTFGRLWDLSKTIFHDNGFNILKDFAFILENDKSIQELSDLLGRQERENVIYEKKEREKVIVKEKYEFHNAYRGEIAGLTLSGNISSAIPSELANFNNGVLKKYFELKLLENKLLSYKYQNRRGIKITQKIKESVRVKKEEKKGPVILCIDTSGSMQGTPENIAKTLSFALAKKSIEEERGCFLISFSNKIEVQDLSYKKGGEAVTCLINFLKMSFNGGTDASPALEKALALLQENKWQNADVLMISDFCMANLPYNLSTRIKEEQEKKTKFYSLVIESGGNASVIDEFNENYLYDTDAVNPMRHLIKTIHKIVERK